MRKLIAGLSVILAAAAFLSFSPSSAGAAETIRLTVGAGHPPVVPWVVAVPKYFIPEVNQILAKTGRYKIQWTEAYGGSIAKGGHVLEAVQDGVLDMGVIVYPFEPSKLFPHNWTYWVPFGSCDSSLIYRIATKMHDQFSDLKTIFEKKYNQKYLAASATNCYGMQTSFPLTKFEQIKGHKIGAAGPNMGMISVGGAVGVNTQFNVAYTSLQTGVYDSIVTFIDPVLSFKLYEHAKYWIETGFGSITGDTLTINKDKFKSLPKAVQDAILEASKHYGGHVVDLGIVGKVRAETELKKHGVTFIRLPWEEKVRWANAMSNIPNIKAKEAVKRGFPFAPALLKAYIKELELAGEKQPRKWKID